MHKLLIISVVVSSCNTHAMLKTAVAKALAGSMAAGTATLSYPKIKQQVEKWKMAQKHKKEMEEQNKVVISNK